MSTQLPSPVSGILTGIRDRARTRIDEFRNQPVRKQAFVIGGVLVGTVVAARLTKNSLGTAIGAFAGLIVGTSLAEREPLLSSRFQN